MSNIVLINDNIEQFNVLVKASNKNTYPIIYNQTTDTYDSIFEKYQSLLNDPSNNIEIINHVMLVSYAISGETFTFLEKEETMLLSKYIHNEKEITNGHDGEIPEPSTNHSSGIKSLNNLETLNSFKEFIQKFNIQKSLDFMECVILRSSNWKYILSELETEQHLNLNIRVCDESNGYLKVGSEWVLESDNVNIKEVYSNH
tara:strand:+ start:1425 stop:2027 length:603 start_codon:yes stop_codon:yes gene_type:complete